MMEMSREVWDEICAQADIDEGAIYLDYSGRAMYGRTCPGFTGDLGTFAGFMAALGEINAQDTGWVADPHELGRAVRTDNMGYDTIYYFPGLELTND